MIQVVQGFQLLTREAVDNRLLLSKAEMLTVDDNQMPEKYFTVCKDDGVLYLYDKSATPTAETGKFKLYDSCKIHSISINGTEIPISDFNVDIPLATASRYGVGMAGYGIKAENGVYSLDFNSLEDKAIPFEKINFDNVIIVGDNI